MNLKTESPVTKREGSIKYEEKNKTFNLHQTFAITML